ncbi:Mu transposase C-terminal domain-containing protein (plasmid) [Rhizobium sp. CB3171]|uniref:Mu transposase C-terminal domain-containing protein n=1 Tax=Rhizobium sp. CB3171 TaxID=3039157 RepID=UPI0024B270A5|nr:Mu transposase C-terminal domain-containing protein [Rhizobium sp. CB3171]WFU07426.1 Mu transposase C-terminal domain-containing protein [Rhizobium sp. CB3171]
MLLQRPSRSDFLRACRELGLRRTRLYELIRAYREHPLTSSLLPQPAGTRRGSRRLPDETEAVIGEALRDFYKTRQKPSINQLHKEIRRLCRLRGVRVPSWHTVKARIAGLEPAALIAARNGPKAARDRFQPVPGQYEAAYAFDIVQIDHTLADIIVVDRQYRKPLQRPWLTLAIDIASRMIAGFYLTLEPPSTVSVALAVQHCVLPKEAWLAGLDIGAEWPVSGFPDAIHLDNAKEFRSRALKRGAQEYGVDLIHRPVATPHYGGHIERLIGTMMGAVHLLPGTTFSDIDERGDYDSAANAAMTLDELERWMALEITRYHADRHSALGIPPLAAWREAVARRVRPVRQPHDLAGFMIDFLPSVDRLVRRDGIHLFGLRYWDDVLSIWAGRLDRPLRASYDPRDLSTIFVRGPDGAQWPIRFADLRRPPITLGEHRRAQAALRERGLALVDEQLIFETIEAQRALVNEATRHTKAARQLAEKRDRALGAVKPNQSAAPAEPLQAHDEPPIDWSRVPIFPVEEWS